MSDRYRITYTEDGTPRMYDDKTNEALSWTDMERQLNEYERKVARLQGESESGSYIVDSGSGNQSGGETELRRKYIVNTAIREAVSRAHGGKR